MPERYETPEEARDEATVVQAIAKDTASRAGEVVAGADYQAADDLVEQVRRGSPRDAQGMIEQRSADEYAKATIGPERMKELDALRERAYNEMSLRMTEARKAIAHLIGDRQNYVDAGRRAIQHAKRGIVEQLAAEPGVTEYFADQDEYRERFWRLLRDDLDHFGSLSLFR